MDILQDPQFERGIELALARDYSGAIAAFEAAALSHPDNPVALKELGLAYARRGEYNVPETLKQRDASEESSDGPGFRSSIGDVVQAALGLAVVSASKAIGQTDWIVRYREDFRRGAAALERSATLAEAAGAPDPETYHVLCQCLRYLGRTEAAREAARKAVELEPTVAAYQARARALEMLPDSSDPAQAAGKATWADVVLSARTKRELRQMQLMLEDPKLAASLGVEPPTGLLLHGPPGTGKTTIARVLASEAKCAFFATSPAEINSMWLGESEKQVKRLFDQARVAAPSIIFLDEIDALLPLRSGGVNMYSDKVVNQFLHEMDGLRANRRVFVVGATNRRDMLDPALLRGGRLSREIEVPLPELEGRKALFELYTRTANLAPDVDLDALAARTDGLSGASIRALINEAGLQALIRIADEPGSEKTVCLADFEEALTNFESQKPDPNADNIDPAWRLWK
jgi:transitional endoplasmic reticulum ATPase